MIKSVNNQDFKIIAVSNRKLCNRPFLEQIERVCKIHPEAVILREKDLTEEEYGTLAKEVMNICSRYQVSCILHNFWKTALELGCTSVHLPLPILQKIADEEKKAKLDEFWNNVEVGKMYTGTVTSLSEYGAFVDINGVVQGLLHISEMTWERDKKPKDILEVGQEIKVKVKEVDKENKRLKLIYDKKGPDPWEKVEEKYKVSDVIPVKVLHFVPFGAFVKIEKGIEGLIHISQICERRIAKPEDALKIGQKVNAKIISIDKENKKIELSIREIEGTSQDTDLMVNEDKSVAVQNEEKGMTTTKETEKSMINTDNNKEIITKD